MEKKLSCTSLVLMLVFSAFFLNMSLLKMSKAQANQDVAVTKVTPSRTSVALGELVNITVVAENQGTENATFSVTLFHDTVTVEIKTATNLTANQNVTLVFTWNTTDVKGELYATSSKDKSYDIKAVASTLPGETDTSDNTLTAANKIKVISHYIAVKPQRTVDLTLTEGKNYTVTIRTDYNGTDIWGWNILLTFSPAILECIEVRNGDLITVEKNPDARFLSNINNTKGELSLGALFYYTVPPPFTTSGPGTLANVTFKVVGTGTSNITLGKNTYIQGYDAATDKTYFIIDYATPDINHLLSGSFSNVVAQIVDIAIVSVEPFPTSVIIGDPVNVTVVVENRGTLGQTFDVKAYFDYTPAFPGQNVIGTKTTQSLAADTNKTFIFTWDTTLVKEGNYIITALVSGVQGDVNTANNQFNSNKTVTVKLEEIRPLPVTELIIGVVVLVAVIAAVSFLLRRRRKKQPME